MFDTSDEIENSVLIKSYCKTIVVVIWFDLKDVSGVIYIYTMTVIFTLVNEFEISQELRLTKLSVCELVGCLKKMSAKLLFIFHEHVLFVVCQRSLIDVFARFLLPCQSM